MTSETLVEGLAGGGVQYAQPLTGSAPPLWSRSTRGGRGLEPELALNHDLRVPAREPEGARAGENTADPGGASLAPPPCPRRVDQSHGSVSTALTSTTPPSMRAARIVGMLRFLPGAHRRCRVDVGTMDTDTPSRLVPSAPPSPPGPQARPEVPPKQVVSEVRDSTVPLTHELAGYPTNSTVGDRRRRHVT